MQIVLTIPENFTDRLADVVLKKIHPHHGKKTVAETCELLRISRPTLKTLESKGLLIPQRVGGRRILYDHVDIETYLKSTQRNISL